MTTPSEEVKVALSEREAFEAWAKRFHYDLTRSDCNSDEPYVQPITDWSWLAWMESAALRRTQVTKGERG